MNNQFLPLGGRSHASLASRRTGGQEVAMAPLATRAVTNVRKGAISIIMEKAPTRAFSGLKAASTALTLVKTQ